jgi:Flp pilus assembly protein TadB
MGTLSKVVVGIVLAVVAVVCTLIVVAMFPPLVTVLLVASSVVLGWWGIGGLRRRRHRFLSALAVCASPILMLAAFAAVFAFAPIHSSNGPTHGAPSGIQQSPSP